MERFPRTVSIEEAFRRLLRAIYPERPALADEIQSYDWDSGRGHHWWHEETNLTSDEVIDVNKAFELLDELVVEQGEIKLRGALHPSKRLEGIDPADVRGSKLHVFAGRLRVFDGHKHIKTYYRVHCYETDIRRCVAELRSETQRNRGSLAKPTSKKLRKPMSKKLRNFTTNYKGQRTLNYFTAAAEAEGINATRGILNAALDTLGPRRRGRPLKSQAK
jgi:hypothetical protein